MNKLVLPVLLGLCGAPAAASDIANAAMAGDLDALRRMIAADADVNEPQIDGATALHWAVHHDDLDGVRLLLEAGADANARNRADATPLQLAVVNRNEDAVRLLVDAGADVNARVTLTGDTVLMIAARTGDPDIVSLLLDRGAEVDAIEDWGRTTALMWAAAEGQVEAARVLIEHGADLDRKSQFIPADTGRGFQGAQPRARLPEESGPVLHASGEMTALMLAARENQMEVARLLVDAGADVNAWSADGKDALGIAIFNGHYDLASFLIDSGSEVDHPDAENVTPLFWAVDRRNMETAPNFPWLITDDPLPLIVKLLEAGADPNYVVNATPRARMRNGSPRVVFGTALMRAAFSADLELVKVLMEYGADIEIKSSENGSVLGAAAGMAFVPGFYTERPISERLELMKLLVENGADVNWQDDWGITPLMAAANLGEVELIQYLVDQGANLRAYDLGTKNKTHHIEPLMPIDYAIGVGTFRPNQDAIFHEEAFNLMSRLMAERGIRHTTSECTLRGFTCSSIPMDPKNASPRDIEKARAVQTGHQVLGNLGDGLEVTE